MERSRMRSAQAQRLHSQAPRITIYIHVRKSMRFGAGIQNQVGNLRSGGMVVMRGTVKDANELRGVRLTASEMLDHMRGLVARSQPLPGPGFGDGFEQRQAFLQASFGTQESMSASEAAQRRIRHRER